MATHTEREGGMLRFSTVLLSHGSLGLLYILTTVMVVVIQAMLTLIDSYQDVSELEANAMKLYDTFKPEVEGGMAGRGKKAEMGLQSIIDMAHNR